MNLPQSLASRTLMSIWYAMQRAPEYEDADSPWHYVSVSDRWDTELTHDREVVYTRHNQPDAKVVLKNIQVVNLGAFTWSPPVVISENVKEQRMVPLRVHTGSKVTVTYADHFSKTTSLEEAAKVGLEIAMETHFGYKASTTTGGLEGGGSLSAKASAEYSRKWGGSDTVSGGEDDTLEIPGPFVGNASLSRSVSKVSMTITTPPTVESQIVVMDGDKEIYSWNSYEELRLVLHGDAPTDRDLSKKFYNDPLSQTEYHAIENHRSIEPVTFAAVYDNVSTTPIKQVLDAEGTRDLIQQEVGTLRPEPVEQKPEVDVDEAIRKALEQHDEARRARKAAKRKAKREAKRKEKNG